MGKNLITDECAIALVVMHVEKSRNQPNYRGNSIFRWCSYCQSYMGKSVPFDKFSLTHGICSDCEHQELYLRESSDKIKEIQTLFESLHDSASSGSQINADTVIESAKNMSISDIDIFIGLIQPQPYELGRLYEACTISIAAEHRFSAFAETVLHELGFTNGYITNDKSGCGILVLPESNQHTLGIKAISLFLTKNNVPHRVFYPGLPNHEILALIDEWTPSFLGLSVTHKQSCLEVVILLDELAAQDKTSLPIIIGGVDNQNTIIEECIRRSPLRVMQYDGNLKNMLNFLAGSTKPLR